MAAYDVYARLMLSDDEHLIEHERIDHDKQDAVQDFLHVGKKHLADQDADVKHIEGYGYGNTELFFQDQGRDVHAACGSARADYDADARADHEAAKHGAEHGIVRKGRQSGELLPERQRHRIKKGTDERCEREFFAEDESAQKKHGEVEGKHKNVEGDVEIMLGGKPESRRAAGDDAGGQQERYDGEGIDRVAQKDQEHVADKF